MNVFSLFIRLFLMLRKPNKKSNRISHMKRIKIHFKLNEKKNHLNANFIFILQLICALHHIFSENKKILYSFFVVFCCLNFFAFVHIVQCGSCLFRLSKLQRNYNNCTTISSLIHAILCKITNNNLLLARSHRVHHSNVTKSTWNQAIRTKKTETETKTKETRQKNLFLFLSHFFLLK